MLISSKQIGIPLPKFALELMFFFAGIVVVAILLYPRVMYYNWSLILITFIILLPITFTLLSLYFKKIKHINKIGLFLVSFIVISCFCIFVNLINELNFKNEIPINAQIYKVKFFKAFPIKSPPSFTIIKVFLNNEEQKITLRSIGHLNNFKNNDIITICKGSGLFGATTYKLECN